MKDFKQGSDIMQLHYEKNHFCCSMGSGWEWGERKNERTAEETHAVVQVKDDGLQQRRRQ